jgi:hypothetical protein
MKTHAKPKNSSSGFIALSKWTNDLGISSTTGWRWERLGWIKTTLIGGRRYLETKEAEDFRQRALKGEFARRRKMNFGR